MNRRGEWRRDSAIVVKRHGGTTACASRTQPRTKRRACRLDRATGGGHRGGESAAIHALWKRPQLLSAPGHEFGAERRSDVAQDEEGVNAKQDAASTMAGMAPCWMLLCEQLEAVQASFPEDATCDCSGVIKTCVGVAD